MQSKIQTSPCGDTGIEIPSIVFGASSLGNLYQAMAPETRREIVSQWIENVTGTVVVDSAGKYGAGLSLESIGKTLAELQVDPQRVVISNKLGWRRVPLRTPEPTFEPGAWIDLKHDAVQDISYDGILRCWEQGCELLGDYRPRLASVHDPDEYLAAATDPADCESRWNDVLEAYRALSELRQRSEVAAIGVGSKDWRVSQRLAEQCKLDWVMLATTLTVYTHEPEMLGFIESLHQRNISVINSAVFHSGFLTGGQFFDYRQVTGQAEGDAEMIDWRSRFNAICDQYKVKPAEACVAFGMSVPGVVATALNSSRAKRVAENVQLTCANPPNEFWLGMKNSGLIRADYPHLGN